MAPATDTSPSLLTGCHCKACDALSFPMQPYGCEFCGSTDTRPSSLSGQGRILAFVTVHLHASPDRKAPFSVATIVTDEGLVLEGLIAPASERNLRHGAFVKAELAQRPAPAQLSHEIHFKVVQEGPK